MGGPLGSKPNHASATKVGRVPFESDAAAKLAPTVVKYQDIGRVG